MCLDMMPARKAKAKAKAAATRPAEPEGPPPAHVLASLTLTEISRAPREPSLDADDHEIEHLRELPEDEPFSADPDSEPSGSRPPPRQEVPTPGPTIPTPGDGYSSRPPPSQEIPTPAAAPASGSNAASTEQHPARAGDVQQISQKWRELQIFKANTVNSLFVNDVPLVSDTPKDLTIEHDEAPLACSLKIYMCENLLKKKKTWSSPCVWQALQKLTRRRTTQLTRSKLDVGAKRAVFHEAEEYFQCFGVEVVWKLAHCLEEHGKDVDLGDDTSPVKCCVPEVYGLVRIKAYDDHMKIVHGQRHQKVYYALWQARPGVTGIGFRDKGFGVI